MLSVGAICFEDGFSGSRKGGIAGAVQLPWLAIEQPWSALAEPFLTLLAQMGSGTTPLLL